jgi:hypothetical protein
MGNASEIEKTIIKVLGDMDERVNRMAEADSHEVAKLSKTIHRSLDYVRKQLTYLPVEAPNMDEHTLTRRQIHRMYVLHYLKMMDHYVDMYGRYPQETRNKLVRDIHNTIHSIIERLPFTHD